MTTYNLTHLKQLEAESIHIIREVAAEFDNPVMLYSVGKDSAVMLHLALKAFYPGKPPFPLMHVDTTWKFRDMIDFRDRKIKEYGLDLIVHTNQDGVEQGIGPFTHGSAKHTDVMKTQGLKQALDKYGFDAAFGGARRDEEKSRAKERVYSFRDEYHRWDPKNQRPELWNTYNGKVNKGESIRVFPLSNWTELDIWQYIYLEGIEIVPLYYSAVRPVVDRDGSLIMVDDDRMPLKEGEKPMMKSIRFRTLGCYPLTGAIESEADTLPEIIQEMLLATSSERQGRVIDHDSAGSMEQKSGKGTSDMSHQSDLIAEDIQAYLKQHENKELLRLLTCGSVDDGKSTLIGRLLHDTKMIYEDHMATLKTDSAKMGTTGEKLDFALLVDGLQAEREQGITIDVAYRYFSTDKRKFIIADTPGHEQYTRNMATGASTAQVAILMIDARRGVLTQTRRHSFIASLLGIRHIVVAINKMDLVDFSEDRFNEIREEYLAFAAKLGLTDIRFVPISALEGDNVVNRSEHTPWFNGQPLMELLETLEVNRDKNLEHFRFPVQYVTRPNLNFRGFCGTIASGVIRPGDKVMTLPSRRTSTIKEVVTFDGNLDEAYIDQAVTLTLTDEIDVSRGDMLVKPEDEPEVGNRFKANIVWMTDAPLQTGRLYDIKLGPTFTSGTVRKIHYQTDVNTLEQHANPALLQVNEIGLCDLTLSQPIAFDAYQRNHATGSFIVIDRLTNVTVGAGMIDGLADTAGTLEPVSPEERQRRLAQKPTIIGCSGSQAPALALAVERALFDQGKTAVILSEDNAGNVDDRRRTAQLLTAYGLIAIAVNLGSDVANVSIAADSTEEVSSTAAAMVQELVRNKRV